MKKSYRTLLLSLIALTVFAFLMVFGLKHNPNFTPSLLVGKTAPAFKAKLSSGQDFQSHDIYSQNNWVIINFWSSSCYVCRDEAHELQDFYQTVSLANKNNPQFLSINIQDDTNSILQWQKNYAQTFPVIEDTKGLISVEYGVTGTPETFFIDPSHTVRYRIAGTVNKKIILHFIQWLNGNPKASEDEATLALKNISQES